MKRTLFLIFVLGIFTSFSSFAGMNDGIRSMPFPISSPEFTPATELDDEEMLKTSGAELDDYAWYPDGAVDESGNSTLQQTLCPKYPSSPEAVKICVEDRHFDAGRLSSCVLYTNDLVSETICLGNRELTLEDIARCSVSSSTNLEEQVCLLMVGKTSSEISSLDDLKSAIEKVIGSTVKWNSEMALFEFMETLTDDNWDGDNNNNDNSGNGGGPGDFDGVPDRAVKKYTI